MSSHFSANQYEDAFNPKKLINWTVPRKHKERPSTLEGFTQIIANDRGHLRNGVPRSNESPWGTFMGTWDMPRKIPPARPSYTARSDRAAQNLLQFKDASPLNTAVNGYKEFTPNKSKNLSPKKTSPLARPNAPTPPKSKSPEQIVAPSAGVECAKDEVRAASKQSEERFKSPSPGSRRAISPTDFIKEKRADSKQIDVMSLPPTPASQKAISPVPSVVSDKERNINSGRPQSRGSSRRRSPQLEVC
uniref:Protein Flattop n=1 Tax=Ciona savignyi TaxID=51511 RepID=H2YQV8_CIOSA